MENKKRFDKNKIVRELIDWLKALLTALVIVLIVIQFLIIGQVDGHSMDPTLSDGQHVITARRFVNYQADDIIAFYFTTPDGTEEFHVKRIVGEPGDTVLVNGREIYVNDQLVIADAKVDYGVATYELSDTEYFVVGDNYERSYDSRMHGPVEQEDFLGKVVLQLPF